MFWDRVSVFMSLDTATDRFKQSVMTVRRVMLEIEQTAVDFRARLRVQHTVRKTLMEVFVMVTELAIRAQDICANARMDTRDDIVEECSVVWVTHGLRNLETRVTCSETGEHIRGVGSARIEVAAIVPREHVHVML